MYTKLVVALCVLFTACAGSSGPETVEGQAGSAALDSGVGPDVLDPLDEPDADVDAGQAGSAGGTGGQIGEPVAGSTAGQGGAAGSEAGQGGSGGSAGQGGSKTPEVIKDPGRVVVEQPVATLDVTTYPRNVCTVDLANTITQHILLSGLCGELPDEVLDYETLDPDFLSVAKDSEVTHFYNQDDLCTVTTKIVYPEGDDGCVETRYLDYNWSPAVSGEDTPDKFLGDGILSVDRVCQDSELDCTSKYIQMTFAL